ncbi:MAG: hypothetical protein HFG46_01590 [Clostridium sp.]|nr:hypothetical protein [Clostridium sp.]
MKHFYKSLFLFFVGFTAYLAIEVCFKSAVSHGGLGCSHPLCGIMGGLSFLIFDQFNNELSWHLDLILQGMLGSCVVTLFELTVGLWDKYFLHIGMWDYSNMPFHYQGVICLPFSLIWIGVSVIAILIADAINYYILDEEPCPHYHVGNLILRYKEKNTAAKH